MSESEPRPKRRKRYSGKNPRRFEDKYKEHDPLRYQETVAKVLASGKTPAGSHVPIMVAECLEALRLQPGMIGMDATLGNGGHAREILQKIAPGGMLLGLDVDPIEQPKTESRMRDEGFTAEVFEAVRSNYAGIGKVLGARQISGVDFIFADLGCSSMQYDDPSRGFSFKLPGPLDMRMNPGRGLSAGEWLQRVSAEKLATALAENSDEPRADLIAQNLAGIHFADSPALVAKLREILAGLDEELVDLTIRRVFQAIRIEVNDEFAALDRFLQLLPSCLKPGGRVAILTFHSGEDRRVKKAFQALFRAGVFSELSDQVGVASADERRANPRSKPAKLRWAVLAD
ncbi:16S rRNA (cytosine(1402)-N(4))-methyltransferase RsmH [Luteolibacter pohnpeiensis]|uniref:16S rRNA (cytosine(1402)-N(4))-methyltransferase RsmH n=1 Tax=Luteolibacter pohnpeiensis TaxID=454153 RepID=UPI001F448701|nr:16S rRNA (cytosine(1402)-N(4))-methyltransferase RsmH [Luteolibacter pohnpeiensis]